MANDFHILAQRLSQSAEAVCAHYLANGRRQGRYWLVGDVLNNPGRSLFVRLAGPSHGAGAAGKWTDAATGQHGDLIDLIRLNRNLGHAHELREEILAFLCEPRPQTLPVARGAQRNSSESARRLFAASRPLAGTLGTRYLRMRGYRGSFHHPALRFHPRCYYRPSEHGDRQELPAIIAAVTDQHGAITGVSRIYLDGTSGGKAAIANPRMALGDLLGNGVRIGSHRSVICAGEGLETMLALRTLAPKLAVCAALSAGHLAALIIPEHLTRLYIAADNDTPGRAAAETLISRHLDRDIDLRLLISRCDDWNTDLITHGMASARSALANQMHPEDVCLLAL